VDTVGEFPWCVSKQELKGDRVPSEEQTRIQQVLGEFANSIAPSSGWDAPPKGRFNRILVPWSILLSACRDEYTEKSTSSPKEIDHPIGGTSAVKSLARIRKTTTTSSGWRGWTIAIATRRVESRH
jgi:hypothetical protein